MTITNEPGYTFYFIVLVYFVFCVTNMRYRYYETGNFGIRIENVMIVANETTRYNNGNFLHLKPLTMVT
jgi:Xaa-Pro aminopeptidase